MRREFNRHYLSLLHFDFPYYNEPDSGCRDEIGLLQWHNNNCKFAGVEIPIDETFAPKFGYRCVHSAGTNTYLYADSAGIFAFDPAKKYTFECFIYPVNNGNIISLYNNASEVFAIKLESGKTAVTGSGYNVNITSADIALNAWHHMSICIESGAVKIYIDGALKQTGTISKSGNISVTQVRLGGFSGYLDEFLYQDAINYQVPSQPYQGIMNIKTLGGFGTGRHGAGSFTNANSNLILNTYGTVTAITNSSLFTAKTDHTGTHGAFTAGDEIFIMVKQRDAKSEYKLAGMYAFANIKAISGNNFTLESAITDFAFNSSTLNDYVIQIVKVPNYTSLLIGENVTVKPAHPFGLIIFRVKGDCTINGKLLTATSNSCYRYDLIQMCNSLLPERYLMNGDGGVFIICGGTFTASSNARMGNLWSGDAKGGTPQTGDGNPGGAGYGGAGGSDTDNGGIGGKGGVGGGGGGGDGAQGGDAGKPGIGKISGAAGTGGGGATWTTGVTVSGGGTQGINLNAQEATSAAGGAGAGGNVYLPPNWLAIRVSQFLFPNAGANVLIACKTLKCDLAAISTGGNGGGGSGLTFGGGGTGFCYIACESTL